jgi:hypothetical protein
MFLRSFDNFDVIHDVYSSKSLFIVFSVSAHPLHHHNAVLIADFHNESVIIAFDVENSPIVCKKICTAIAVFDVLWGLPGCPLSFINPCLQRLSG